MKKVANGNKIGRNGQTFSLLYNMGREYDEFIIKD